MLRKTTLGEVSISFNPENGKAIFQMGDHIAFGYFTNRFSYFLEDSLLPESLSFLTDYIESTMFNVPSKEENYA